MISRRGFLKGLIGLAAAPAICKAENLMKIIVPSQELIVPNQQLGRGMTESIYHIDEAAFFSADYDGDVINYNLVQLTEHQTQRLLSSKHLHTPVMQTNKVLEKFLKEHSELRGKTLIGARNPSLMTNKAFNIRSL